MAEKLQSVTHALLTLKLLRRTPSIGVSEVAAELGVGVSTAHRLLATLAAEGFVQQRGGRKYELGREMLGSASAIEHCAEVSAPVMRRLRDISRETVHLSIVRGAETFFLSAVESNAVVRVTTRVGERPPAHSTGAGKVLLASLSREAFLELYPDESLGQATDLTIEDREALWDELRHVEQVGYATNLGESEFDMYAIAVPIRRPDGPPVCALSLAAPLSRINPTGDGVINSEEAALLEQLRTAAREIESLLVY
ncbi:IclR family transcriptional regulator [Arthrobacter sp. I2-34]|uniref:IclR family transcriptional regulator n=1 Tax=Arthrobacter hankyongi TaxID=2904801 RepID=A0ABS9LB33_9MICC|nr:IclR family transcriptional regulator [Arthrobacter hankyongi]MCG2623677.1 IclR family transcriptional regulator [Arthrobacter hankyongi]